jgi:hypothetical protein
VKANKGKSNKELQRWYMHLFSMDSGLDGIKAFVAFHLLLANLPSIFLQYASAFLKLSFFFSNNLYLLDPKTTSSGSPESSASDCRSLDSFFFVTFGASE